MQLTPDEIRDLLSIDRFPRSVTDMDAFRLTTDRAPRDTIAIVYEAVVWGTDTKVDRHVLSMCTAAARQLHAQLGTALGEIDAQPPPEGK